MLTFQNHSFLLSTEYLKSDSLGLGIPSWGPAPFGAHDLIFIREYSLTLIVTVAIGLSFVGIVPYNLFIF
jgi:hypothetical protein